MTLAVRVLRHDVSGLLSFSPQQSLRPTHVCQTLFIGGLTDPLAPAEVRRVPKQFKLVNKFNTEQGISLFPVAPPCDCISEEMSPCQMQQILEVCSITILVSAHLW